MASVSRRIRRTIVHATLRIGNKSVKQRGGAWRQKRWADSGKPGAYWDKIQVAHDYANGAK